MMHDDMDEIYRRMPPGDIPWNIEEPPEALIELVESGTALPCKAIDLGCGIGNYAVYLAGKGFDVTGVDISLTAIGFAKDNARKKRVECDFIAADLLGDMNEVKGTFDFAYDWELLHHIFPEYRVKYVENVYSILNSNGRYLSLCFSEENTQFGGSGKYRETPLGTHLYFSSEEEISNLFTSFFHIIELKTIKIKGKYAPHLAIYAFMEKR